MSGLVLNTVARLRSESLNGKMTEAGDKKKVTTRVIIGIDDSQNCLQAFECNLSVRFVFYRAYFNYTFCIADYVDHIHKPGNEVILFHVSDQVRVPAYAYMSGTINLLLIVCFQTY